MLSKSRLVAAFIAVFPMLTFATHIRAATLATAEARLGDLYAPFSYTPSDYDIDYGTTHASVSSRAVGLDERDDRWHVNASGSSVVGSNGTSGLGLMKLNLDVFYDALYIDVPPYPDEIRPGAANIYRGSATATWQDTLHLEFDVNGPVYMKFLVTGDLAITLAGAPYGEFYAFRQGSANASLTMQSYASELTATVGTTLESVRQWVPGTTQDWVPGPVHLVSSFNAEGFESYNTTNGFSGIVLLPVYSQGNSADRPFTLQGSVNVTTYNAHAEADFGHTVSFLGVTDANGNPIAGATFESGLTPAIVPEPSAAVLAGVMAVVLGGMSAVRSNRPS